MATLNTTPFANFQVSSGTTYTADVKGNITATVDQDITDLVNAGCTVVPSDASNWNVLNTLTVGAGAATWTSGSGAPTSTQPAGSLYSRLDGGSGTRLYVSAGGGTWNAITGS